jgi:quercetin dioxygenase-like cupin family protein
MPNTPGVARRDLLTATIAAEIAVSRVEVKEVTMAPRQRAPLHLHPCPVVGVITQGTICYQIEGESAERLEVGDAFYEPANVRVARFDNETEAPARFAAFYLLGKDDQELIRVLDQDPERTS